MTCARKIHAEVCTSCALRVISLSDETATIPTTICTKKNSTGAGTTTETHSIVAKCKKSAVLESKKTRVRIGTQAKGIRYTDISKRKTKHANPATISMIILKKSTIDILDR